MSTLWAVLRFGLLVALGYAAGSPRRRQLLDQLVVVAWNPHRGNTAARICDGLDTEVRRGRPGVIVLNEVRRHHGTLERWAERNGYVHYQEQPHPERAGEPVPEHGSTAIVVDEDLDVLSHRVIAMRVGWMVFSHRRAHRPRRYERIRLRTPGRRRWKITGAHWPTNGFTGGNRAAFAESAARAAAAFASALLGTVVLDVGDHNEDVKTLRRWARPLGATVTGHGPDSTIAAGVDVEASVGPKDGSDHHRIRYTATPRSRAWWRRRRAA